jgi:hypothetical protein
VQQGHSVAAVPLRRVSSMLQCPRLVCGVCLPLLLLLQENKKVQEISGNITKSIASAF